MKIKDLLGENWNKRDAYQRDYDSSVSGMGHKDSLAYRMDGGANDEGWDEEEPRHHRSSYRSHSSSANAPHDVHIDGRKWKTFDSHSHASNVAKKLQAKGKNATVHKSLEESATAGATSAASIGTVVNPHISPGKARGQKSYTGSPGKSGTKAPPQPKPKAQKPTDNALDMKGTSIFGGSTIKRR